jgi:hypothetical protein
MDEPKQLITIKTDGSVEVPDERVKKRLGTRAGRYQLAESPTGLLVLRKSARGKEKNGATRVLMAGDIVSRSTVLEIVGMIGQAAWSGQLTVYGKAARRSLLIDQGALRSAVSTVPGERLGEILLSRRVITRPQLSECLKQIGGQRRFGEILMDSGYIARETLFENLYLQIETIFNAALLEGEGSYVFATLAEDAVPPAMKVHLPLSQLLLEGVQRIDEMALYRKHVPRSSLRPSPLRAVSDDQLDEALLPVARLADGERNLKQIAVELGWDEFKTTKAVYQLVQSGYLELVVPSGSEAETVRRLVSEFNRIMRGIFAVVAKHGGKEEMPWTLKAWMESSGLTRYVGEELGKQCTVDPDQVLAALAAVDDRQKLPALLKALHDLASFALFSATPCLPRKVEEKLARLVDKRLKNLHL